MLSGFLAWEKRACIERVKPCVTILETNHPGNQGLDAHHGRKKYAEAVKAAAAIIGCSQSPSCLYAANCG